MVGGGAHLVRIYATYLKGFDFHDYKTNKLYDRERWTCMRLYAIWGKDVLLCNHKLLCYLGRRELIELPSRIITMLIFITIGGFLGEKGQG